MLQFIRSFFFSNNSLDQQKSDLVLHKTNEKCLFSKMKDLFSTSKTILQNNHKFFLTNFVSGHFANLINPGGSLFIQSIFLVPFNSLFNRAISISFFPFQKGDTVKLKDFKGEVEEINFKYLVLSKKGDGIVSNSLIYIPIDKMWTETFEITKKR